MAWLYLDESLPDDEVGVGRSVTIGGPDARHAAVVTRVRAGERVGVGNGRGVIGFGPVLVSDPKALTVHVEEVRVEERREPTLWLAQALAKGDRDEMAVQASTELGVSGVIPWQAERSVSRWDGPKQDKGIDRWRTIAREAAKQSIRPHVPEVLPLVDTAKLAKVLGTILVLDPEAELALTALPDEVLETNRLVLAVGPEGGISPKELEALDEAGAIRVRLGDTVLRTSTAGPAAIAVLLARLGRW